MFLDNKKSTEILFSETNSEIMFNPKDYPSKQETKPGQFCEESLKPYKYLIFKQMPPHPERVLHPCDLSKLSQSKIVIGRF